MSNAISRFSAGLLRGVADRLAPQRPQGQTQRHPGMVFPSIGSWTGTGYEGQVGRYGWLGGALPGSDIDWTREAGDPALCHVAAACLRWLGDNIPEPTLRMARRSAKGGTETPVWSHPLLEALAQPNPFYNQDAVLTAIATSYFLYGNAYLLKDRQNDGQVKNLWYVPTRMIAPRWNSEVFIQDYLYRPTGHAQPVVYPVEDVVHIRWGVDEWSGGRLGTHRSFAMMREIATINEASTFTYAILKNYGIMPYLVSLKNMDRSWLPEERDKFREMLKRLFTRDGRAQAAVIDAEMEITKLGGTPEELRLNQLPTRAELAVCGLFGIPPELIFLQTRQNSGATMIAPAESGNRLYEARRMAYQDCLEPFMKQVAKALTHQLLPDFENSPRRLKSMRLIFDFSHVDALAEDLKSQTERMDMAVRGGWATRAEGRSQLGLPVTDADHVYFIPAGVQVVPAGQGTGADSSLRDETVGESDAEERANDEDDDSGGDDSGGGDGG